MPDKLPDKSSNPPLAGPHFVATGEDGMRCFSRDGRVWLNTQSGRDGEIYSAVAFGNGRCVMAARFGGAQVTSATPDGATWQTTTYDAKYVNYLQSLFFFGDRFLGIGVNFFTTSEDGVKWDPMRPLPAHKAQYGIDPTLHRFAIGNGLLVGVGDFGNSVVTRNGREWTFAPKNNPANSLIDIAFGNGVFVGGGMHGLRMRSADGLTWTDRVIGEEGEHINFINWDGRQFVGVGLGATYLSPDGLKWERVPNQNAPTLAVFGRGAYLGCLWPGKILHSVDGVAWKQTAELTKAVACLAFGELGKP